MLIIYMFHPFYRFLRRLEQALKDRDRLVHLEDRHEDDNEPLNSTKATIPLLSPSVSSSSSVCKMSRQKKIPVIDDFRSE